VLCLLTTIVKLEGGDCYIPSKAPPPQQQRIVNGPCAIISIYLKSFECEGLPIGSINEVVVVVVKLYVMAHD